MVFNVWPLSNVSLLSECCRSTRKLFKFDLNVGISLHYLRMLTKALYSVTEDHCLGKKGDIWLYF